MTIKNGDFVLAKVNQVFIDGMIFQESPGVYFLLHNDPNANGSRPGRSDKMHGFRYSWVFEDDGYGGYHMGVKILKIKNKLNREISWNDIKNNFYFPARVVPG